MLELLVSEYRPVVQNVLAYAICLAALVWGAGPERAIALAWLLLFEAVPGIYKTFWGARFQLEEVDILFASLDLCAGAFWLIVALNANRNYPLVIAALQLLVISAHIARGLIDAISPVAYAAMVMAPGWLQLLLLGAGLVRHVLRERTYGPYREWRVPVRWYGLRPIRQKRV
ncbi:MAG: hypothetical protein QNI87_11940 [Erythrobacter sp.]|uniref:hypothetical protein n=1 Tax=Erythrobacter sp. TaxID=1042 RepID=UPI0026327176|nr:hypothetical protein [Erythrobacter sp.]MDJ0979227.1 hypothetical protein [Erythrobacter sp.]